MRRKALVAVAALGLVVPEPEQLRHLRHPVRIGRRRPPPPWCVIRRAWSIPSTAREPGRSARARSASSPVPTSRSG